MGPDPGSQIRFGLGACLAVLVLVLVLAFVPDPFFRNHDFVTRLDDVAGVQPGTEVDFRGSAVGEVRSVALDPASHAFTVGLSVAKAWQPGACSHVVVDAANPLTAPRMTLVVLDGVRGGGQACAAARLAADCVAVPLPPGADGTHITGCKRAPDLIQTATVALAQAASVAATANQMALRLHDMLQGPAGGGGQVTDMAAVATNATQTLAALNSLSVQLDHAFQPGRGDVAMTLGNVRRLTDRAAQIDMKSANQILLETRDLLAKNQAAVAELLAQGAGTAREAHASVDGAAASVQDVIANLQRISDNLGALTERISADPTFVIRGQHYADPPKPGAHP